jgi:hypothetical protein
LWKGLSIDQILALHRFGKKYLCDTMSQAVANRLHVEFPRKLDDFLAIYTSHLTHTGKGACKCGTLVCAADSLAKIINYAMESDLQAILPAAFFLASGLSISDIISGVPVSGSNNHVSCVSLDSRLGGITCPRKQLFTKRKMHKQFREATTGCNQHFSNTVWKYMAHCPGGNSPWKLGSSFWESLLPQMQRCPRRSLQLKPGGDMGQPPQNIWTPCVGRTRSVTQQ